MAGKKELEGKVNKETLARWLNLTARRVEQLGTDGILKKEKVGNRVYYDLLENVHIYIKYLSDRAAGKDRTEGEARLKEQKLRAEIALKESQGELHQLRTEIAVGNYISIDEVKSNDSRFFVVFKNFALAIPSKVSGRIAGFLDPVEVREIESDLQREIKSMLTDFVDRARVVTTPIIEDVTKPKKAGRPRKNAEKK